MRPDREMSRLPERVVGSQISLSDGEGWGAGKGTGPGGCPIRAKLAWAVVLLGALHFSQLTAQSPTLTFLQVADGDGIQSEIVLTNPGSLQDTGTLFFKGNDGTPLTLTIEGQEINSLAYGIAPGGYLSLLTDGAGSLKTGYVTVVSDVAASELTGSIGYNLSGFEVSIPDTPLGTEHHVYAERNASTGANSGIAVSNNTGSQEITVSLRLLASDGGEVAQASLPLATGEQVVRFVDQLFSGVPSEFVGSVRASSSSEFALVGIRQQASGSLAILSGSTLDPSASTLVFPQLADGAGIGSEIILLNSGDQADEGTLSFLDEDGQPLSIVIGGTGRTSIPYTISPQGVFKITTDGSGDQIRTGYARLDSQSANPFLNGNIVYSFSGFEVSVPNSPLSDEYHVFVVLGSGVNSGIAAVNPNQQDITLSSRLFDLNGMLVAQRSLVLGAGSQSTQFVDQLFTDLPPQVTGSVHITSTEEFSLFGIRQRDNGSLSTLSSSTTAISADPGGAVDEGDYWLPVDLPDLTMPQRTAYCSTGPVQREQFRADQMAAARRISDDLEAHIRAWLAGEAPAEIPAGLLPDSIDNEKTHSWRLLRPEEVDPNEQWYVIPARQEPALDGFSTLYQQNAATNVSYIKLVFIAPFDSQVLVEGDFGHSREMSYHIIGPVDPLFPVTGNMGIMEVPIIDVDIDPDEGHVNPYRLGADRNAVDRHYHLIFDLKEGNAIDLNPVLQDQHFRAPGNTRVGGPFGATGPWGDGVIIPSILWLRYYAPDLNPDGKVDPLAGVELPRVLLRLDTGEEFWLQPDFSLGAARQKTTAPGISTLPLEPVPLLGPSLGWFKIFGILLTHFESRGYQIARPYGAFDPSIVRAGIRKQIACLFNQGLEQEPPGNIAHSATDMPYNNYLVRPFWLGEGKVYALTGRLPTTPRTRNGEAVMEAAEARYWSICHTADVPAEPVAYNSLGYGCIMDDEIATDGENDYILVFSQPQDKPDNARPECGVTWQNFGPQSSQAFVIRWMSVFPDHFMGSPAPTDENVTWAEAAWSQDTYDPSVIGENRPGAMGPYHPVIHYLDREEFEALGCPVDPASVPTWVEQ